MSLPATAVKHSRLEPGERRPPRPPRILPFISSFQIGGTEKQLAELLNRINRDRYDVLLACIHGRGRLYQEAVRLFGEIPEFPLRRFYDLNALTQSLRLRSFLVTREIDIIHTHDFYSG